MPIPRRDGGTSVTSRPSIQTRPVLGQIMPEMIFSSVVLPEPLGPSRVRNSPRRTSSVIGRNACTGPGPVPDVVEPDHRWVGHAAPLRVLPASRTQTSTESTVGMVEIAAKIAETSIGSRRTS